MSDHFYKLYHLYIPESVYIWADILWIPLALLIVHKGQKIKACAFIIVCMLVMRLQIEIVEMFEFPRGITGLLDFPVLYKGYIIYGFFILLFLLLSYFSRGTRGPIYLAAGLSIFFMAFAVSSIVMIF